MSRPDVRPSPAYMTDRTLNVLQSISVDASPHPLHARPSRLPQSPRYLRAKILPAQRRTFLSTLFYRHTTSFIYSAHPSFVHRTYMNRCPKPRPTTITPHSPSPTPKLPKRVSEIVPSAWTPSFPPDTDTRIRRLRRKKRDCSVASVASTPTLAVVAVEVEVVVVVEEEEEEGWRGYGTS